MYLYNVTVNIEEDVHDKWLNWMKDTHIPDVMATGCFVANRMLMVLSEIENNGKTYSIQYYFNRMEDYLKYQEKFAPGLQKAHSDQFRDKYVAFRTLLKIVE